MSTIEMQLNGNHDMPQEEEVVSQMPPVVDGAIPSYRQKAPERRVDYTITPEGVALFGKNAMQSYGETLHGEYIAKWMYAAGLLMGAINGGGVGVIGHPGGGKSALTRYGWSIINGYDEQKNIAVVPHRLDLMAAELIGKDSKLIRELTSDAGDMREEISSKVDSIVKEYTKAILFDEGNRTSPLAINAGLEVMQDGKMYTWVDGKRVEVSAIDLVATAINNHGTAHTNKFDPAFIGRHSMAAFMNERDYGLTEGADWRIEHPDQVFESGHFRPVIQLEELHEMREKISQVGFGREEKNYLKGNLKDALNYLKVHGMDFADTRTADQLVRMSQAFALLRGQETVNKGNINEAMTFWMIARLGMTGRIDTNEDANKIVASSYTYSLDRMEEDKEEKKEAYLKEMEDRYDAEGKAAVAEAESFLSQVPTYS